MTSKQPSRFDPIRKLAPALQKTTPRWGTVRRLKGDMIRCLLTSRLDIDRRRGLSLGAPRRFASEDAKPVHHPVVSSVVAPRVKIVPNRLNGQKTKGKCPPLALGVEHVLDRVDRRPKVGRAGRPSWSAAVGTVRPKPIFHSSNRFQPDPEGVYIASWWSRSRACFASVLS